MNLLSLFFTSMRLANTVDRDRVRLNNDSEYKDIVVRRLCNGDDAKRVSLAQAPKCDFSPGRRHKTA